MGPPESATNHGGNQDGRRRRPRPRSCLLKGCEVRFHPRQARQRYCSEGCRQAARKWSRWKAQAKYRATRTGKQKRNRQNQRYRERVRCRKPPEPEAARVITQEPFFRANVRSAGVLRGICAAAAKSVAALLLPGMPASAGARAAARTALETSSHLIPTY